MKVLITWQMHEGKHHDTLALFTKMPPEQEEALMGSSVKLLSRWHDMVRGSGVAVYEADSAEAISAYAMNWNRYMDLDISVVVDDGAAREIGQAMEAGN